MRARFLSGAASGAGLVFITIVFMTIVLVIMGYSSIAWANQGTRAVQESVVRNQKFYYLDGKGTEFIAHMDALLLNAQMLTNEYIESGAYAGLTHPHVQLPMQTFIREGSASAANSTEFLNQVIEMVFFLYADRELEALSEVYSDVVITVAREYTNDFENVRALIADITFTHPQAYNLHLSITVSVNSYNAFRHEIGEGNTATRYRITSWRLWQS